MQTVVTKSAVLTIVAHPGSEQDVANAFELRPSMMGWVASYGENYMEQGVLDFAFYALTEQQQENIRQSRR